MENETKKSTKADATNTNSVEVEKFKKVDSGLQMSSVNNLQLDIVHNPEGSLKVLTHLCNSGVLPCETPEQALVYYQIATELDIPFISNISHMTNINGKLGVDIHIVKGLLLRAGSITWEKTKDYELQYEYTDSIGVYTFNPSSIPEEFGLIPMGISNDNGAKLRDKYVNEGKIAIYQKSKVPNYVTTYKFTREVKSPVSGNVIIITEYGTFSSNEATTALLGYDKQNKLNPSSPWVKYRPHMVATRAFTYGSRAIADDIINGIYTKDELADVYNKPYDLKGEDVVFIED